jgi:acyl-CoA synthetase (AMP-forming)/AMP-acid ligase II
MLRRSTNAAKSLKQLGVHSGDIITFCASNTDDVYPLLFGAIMAEAIINPLDPKFMNCKQ